MTVTTIAGLVHELGGVAAVADVLHCHHSQPLRWIERGFIPTGWHFRLYRLAQKRGIAIDTRALFDDD